MALFRILTNKRIVCTGILLLALFTIPGSVLADYIRIKGTVVNIRQGPGTAFPVLYQSNAGDEFELISIEGLWCRVLLPDGKEAWVFRRLVNIVPGKRPGEGKRSGDSGDEKGASTGNRSLLLTLFTASILVISALGVWRRKAIMRFTGFKLREMSGYRRDDPFRYDGRPPERDSWEM